MPKKKALTDAPGALRYRVIGGEQAPAISPLASSKGGTKPEN